MEKSYQERLARREGECDPGSLNIHRKECQTSTICWMHRVGLCSEEGSCSWGILTAYRTKGESSLDSEGTGSKSPG